MEREKSRVLCIDDEPGIVRSLQWLLQKDFEVLTASCGHDALQLVQEHDLDVVISDQRMPGMSGVEVLREIRRMSPRTMRILLTGYSDMNAIVRSVNESEVFRFVNKPWNIAELPKVVAQAAEIARTRPPEADTDLTEEMPVCGNGDCILVIDDDPAMGQTVAAIVGEAAKVSYASNLADAVDILNKESVSVIVSETRVGSIDATRLVRLMKNRHPEIVTVMLSEDDDADTLTALINQGQIYRFVPKPVRSGYLKLVLNSALRKHNSLSQQPGLNARHAVEPATAGALDSLMIDVQRAASQYETRSQARRIGLMAAFGAGFRRLLGV